MDSQISKYQVWIWDDPIYDHTFLVPDLALAGAEGRKILG
jgi:hypothetical protein